MAWSPGACAADAESRDGEPPRLFQPGKVQLQLHSDLSSDPLALRHFDQKNWSDFIEARPGTNLVQVDQQLRLSAGSSQSGIQVGLLKRNFARLVIGEDTVRRLSQIDRGQDASSDWTLRPELMLKGFSGEGLEWTYRLPHASGWYGEAGVQMLRLSRLYGRELQGQAAYEAADQAYNFNVQSTQVGSRLKLPFQSAGDPYGQGLLFNARAGWQGPSLGGWLGVRDLGKLRWQGVPQQVLAINSATRQRDADGYVIYKPLILGQNSQPNLMWSAPWTLDAGTSWRLSAERQVAIEGQYIPQFGWLPSLRWTQASGPVKWSAQWRHHQQDAVLQLQWQGWGLGASSQNFQSDAKAQFWTLTYAHQF